jgi:hypothetical protein
MGFLPRFLTVRHGEAHVFFRMIPDRFLNHVTSAMRDYTPFSIQLDEYYFERLEERLIEISQWEGTIEIERKDFESLICNSSDLEDVYIEMYETKSRFFVSEMSVKDQLNEFYMLVQKQQVVLIFYRKIDEDKSRFL